MSMNQYPMPPDGMQPPRKPGMSTGAKVLIVLGIVFLVLLVLCCGGLMLSGYFMQRWASDMASDDPATIVEVTNGITQIEIPEELEPTASIDMKVPFSDQTIMVSVVYQDEETGSVLILASMGDAFGSENQAQMRRSIDQSLRQQGMGDQEDMVIEQSYQKDVEIRGETATFTIAKGVGKESKTPRIQVTGVFQGRSGPVMLIFNGDADKFSEDEVVQMLDSIK